LQGELARYDVLGEQLRLTGVVDEDSIEVIVLYFSKPHGIRIQGPRFLTHVSYPADIVLRNAAHEPLHPMFNLADEHVRALVSRLGSRPLLAAILAKHDPSFGYNSADGLIDEDSVQALEQVVSERLGFAKDARERWRTGDDGMHVFAAVLYDLMRESGYAESGGHFVQWLMAREADGALSAEAIEKRARHMLGDDAVDKWLAPSGTQHKGNTQGNL
jgi:hypothetical protein